MKLENMRLLVEISQSGAELMRIYDKAKGIELLWNGDAAYWKRRSPILFPNVGKTFGNVMNISGKSYPTCQHGFARDSVFALEESDESHAVYVLKSNGAFSDRYPFEFELRIGYRLEKDSLKVIWKVNNTGNGSMAFTIGGHPAFCFDEDRTKEDYLLEFPRNDALEYILLDPASGAGIPEKKYPLPLENRRLELSDSLFARDAMVFDGGQVSEVWLCEKDGSRRVGMACEGFPNYGIWSVQGAPFVCLEPWMGRADDLGFDGDIFDKKDINIVPAGGEFEKAYSILLA